MKSVRNPRDTRLIRGTRVAAGAVIALLVLVPPAGAVSPAVKEYSLNFPNAKGKSYPGAETPSARPSELSPRVRRALSHRPDGKALAAVATAPALGAPTPAANGNSGSGEDVGGSTPSFISAALGGLGDAAVILGLLALLGVIGLFAYLARVRPARNQA
jgi:hypothetical protein